jgi:hypothetical protein
MRNMLAFFAALLLSVAGVGWYLGWYTIHSTPAPDGQRSVTVDINTVKIARDLRAAEERIQQELTERSQKRQADAAREKPKAETVPWFKLPEVPAKEEQGEKKSDPAPVLWVDD